MSGRRRGETPPGAAPPPAEYEFIDTLWPDFDGEALAQAVATFGRRQRRYGGL